MQTSVTVSFGSGAYVPASIGGEPIWQQPVSTIRVGDMVRICVDGTHSALFTSHGVAEAETVRLEAERDGAIRRLARKARAEGVQLYRDARDGRHYASSVSCPGKMHYLTGVSCDCMGFASHGRCKHHSALLVALGWVDDSTFEPDPIHVVGTDHEQLAA